MGLDSAAPFRSFCLVTRVQPKNAHSLAVSALCSCGTRGTLTRRSAFRSVHHRMSLAHGNFLPEKRRGPSRVRHASARIACTARVAPRRAGSAVPAAPAVRDDESSHRTVEHEQHHCEQVGPGSRQAQRTSANGRGNQRHSNEASAAEPNRRFVAQHAARVPASPRTVRAVAGESAVADVWVLVATNARNATPHPLSAFISRVWMP
jgi:hypothetical protein